METRAALPRGKMLSPEIKISIGTLTVYLIGNNDANRRFQNSYNTPDLLNETYPDTDALIAESDLTNFHTYGLQFNRHDIHWYFDGHNQMSLTGAYARDFSSNPVYISIALNIGGNEYANQSLEDSDHMEWQCSAFIVDYIR
ncbi:unnamed protein product, partial [Oppiella nova]